MTINCPKCGSGETNSLLDETTLRQSCRNCGEIFDEPVGVDEIIAEGAKRFKGELMRCMMCSREQESNPNSRSQWTYLQEKGEAFGAYVCPGCLQESEQAKRGHIATVYQKVIRRFARLRERHYRGLNN